MRTRLKARYKDQFTSSGKHAGADDITRSKLTTQQGFLPEHDGRTRWGRRFKDVIADLTIDLGGDDCLSEGQRNLIRRVAHLTVAAEHSEAECAIAYAETGNVNTDKLESHRKVSESLRRLFESLGLNKGRPAKDITLTDYQIRERNTRAVLRQFEREDAA